MSEEELRFEELDDPVLFAKAKEKVIKRCETAGLKFEEKEIPDYESKCLVVHLPSGRDSHKLYLMDTKDADALVSIPFENYRMLGEYVGIYSYVTNSIEVNVRTLGAGPTLNYFIRHFLVTPKGQDSTAAKLPLILSEGDISVKIGPPSPEFVVFQEVSNRLPSLLTLTISNSGAKTHEKVLATLEKISNAVFFQIGLNIGCFLGVQRERRFLKTARAIKHGAKENIAFPSREYDSQPMSLYWYAKSATGMPLLQFLAYYQVLEYFMPTCSNYEAIGRVRNIIKDPRFNPDTESQVVRILASLRVSGRSFGEERSQLEAVIRRSVSPHDLREFYESNPELRAFYESGYKLIASQKIPIQNANADLIAETALRLYEIRCRIVHTKDSSDRELSPLLPYSREASELYFDISLIESIATAALVAASAPLKVRD